MSFESLVSKYQVENKCSKATAIRAVVRAHPEEHEEYLAGLGQRIRGHKQGGSRSTTQRTKETKPDLPPASSLIDPTEAEVKKYVDEFILGMRERDKVEMQRDLKSGYISYAVVFSCILQDEFEQKLRSEEEN